jgi:hypothetical protein
LHGEHWFAEVSQIGEEAGQRVLSEQPQVEPTHCGVTLPHVGASLPLQTTQAPALQTPLAAVGQGCADVPGLKSPSQATQVLDPVSHTGAVAGQSVDVEQPQVWFVVLQSGVEPLQALLLELEHWSHWPPTQAGIVFVGHARVAVASPLSPLHSLQVWLVASHTGFVAGQSVLELQPQLLFDRQTGFPPVHAAASPVLHSTQLPPLHTPGSDVGHLSLAADVKSPLQATHVPELPSHTGAVDGQLALDVHPQVLLGLHAGLVPPQAVRFPLEH